MQLKELWNEVYRINKKHFPENSLVPICGNGKLKNPKFMFVFINPTHANQSSRKEWTGPRFPFLGTKSVWRVFYKAGLFDNALMDEINSSKVWSRNLAEKVLNFLNSNSFYFTNIVKFTGNNAELPDSFKIKLFLPLIEKEIKIVNPEFVVAFGLIPFENLTKIKLKLKDYYEDAVKNKKLKIFLSENKKIIPCYFPVGRGNPAKSAKILSLLKNMQ